ncbi:MAG: HEAT repeat domain-containing protein [Sphingobacteriales bacterium]|nr:MAG: HEAT repeat domain-containing protein [Sphingobacteriales bacterium]
MAFYDLPKDERIALTEAIKGDLRLELQRRAQGKWLAYAGDEDTYIRKAAYLALGKLYADDVALLEYIIGLLQRHATSGDFRVRQTVINAAGEIGKYNFAAVQHFFDQGLSDKHHSPRNAVIGSVKKMGEVNPGPVLEWARGYLHHPDKEIRREICHGIELRGRKHPQDILPMLATLQFDATARVRNTLVHVIGQIAYKKGCLETVTAHLSTWENKALVEDAVAEIIDVHDRYRNFSFYTQDEAKAYLEQHWSELMS